MDLRSIIKSKIPPEWKDKEVTVTCYQVVSVINDYDIEGVWNFKDITCFFLKGSYKFPIIFKKIDISIIINFKRIDV